MGAHDRRTHPVPFWLPPLLPHLAVLHRFHQLTGHNWLTWPQFRGHSGVAACVESMLIHEEWPMAFAYVWRQAVWRVRDGNLLCVFLRVDKGLGMAREGDEREEEDVYHCEKGDGHWMVAAVECVQGSLEIYPGLMLPERGNMFHKHLFIRDAKHHIPLKFFRRPRLISPPCSFIAALNFRAWLRPSSWHNNMRRSLANRCAPFSLQLTWN